MSNPANNVVAMKAVETPEQELIRLRAENAALKAKGTGFKITEKGGLSVYGLGRFPVTLYKSQWLTLISKVDDIQAFIVANGDKMTDKKEA